MSKENEIVIDEPLSIEDMALLDLIAEVYVQSIMNEVDTGQQRKIEEVIK